MNYRIGEKLQLELQELSKLRKIKKRQLNVKIYDSDTIITSSSNLIVYELNEVFLFFQGKDEVDTLIIWLYHNSSDKMLIKNCQIRGRIISIREGTKTKTYEVQQTFNFLPFYFGRDKVQYEIYKE
jgi:hypothetical protein